jgi:hypothetical protein
VLIQRFDGADLPDVGDLPAGRTERGVMVCTAFQLHPWYPAVSRQVHGTTLMALFENGHPRAQG